MMTGLTLLLNGIVPSSVPALAASLVTGSLVCIAIGLLYGTLARTAKSLYTMVKSLNILIAAPVIFYIFPGWPAWIARLFPTYWFIDPIYRVTQQGADLRNVGGDLLIALGTGILLALLVVPLGRRLRGKIAAQ
jgi:ABC-2 type transport system permease protein